MLRSAQPSQNIDIPDLAVLHKLVLSDGFKDLDNQTAHRLWVKFREVTFTALLATIWCGEKSTINTSTMGDGDEEKMTQSMSL